MRAAPPPALAPVPRSARRCALLTARARSSKLDVYRCARAAAPINVYIHGGAWRSGRSADFAFLAEMLVHAGAHSVILDFINIDEARGDLMTMARQVRSAVAWVYKQRRHIRRRSETGSMSPAIPPAAISAAAWSPPTGRRSSACRRTW